MACKVARRSLCGIACNFADTAQPVHSRKRSRVCAAPFSSDYIRACVHRRLSTSFRQILLHTALKILAIRKYACKFLPCLQKNLLENPHIFPMNTSSQFRERFPSPQIFQISFAYSFTARSAEKMPALAMLCRDILVHVSLSVYSLELCSCT